MFGSLKNKLEMLQSSKRDIIIFEITYKLAATAVIYPAMLLMLHLGMKLSNVRYLTNEYIASTLTNPLVIAGIAAGLMLLALYCFLSLVFLLCVLKLTEQGAVQRFSSVSIQQRESFFQRLI